MNQVSRSLSLRSRILAYSLLCMASISGCNRRASSERTSHVQSSSMAPFFQGQTVTVRCRSCAAEHAAAVEHLTEFPKRCLRCGGPADAQLESPVETGSPVRLEPVQRDTLERMQVVLFDAQAGLTIKRIWGLPGERLEFRAGDLFVDGRRFQKSLRDLDTVAVLVDQWPRPDGLSPGPAWQLPTENLKHASQPIELRSGDELRWQHLRQARVPVQEVASEQWLEPSPLLDDYACNEGLTYDLQPVSDFLVEIQFAEPVLGDCWLSVSVAGLEHQLRVGSEHSMAATASPRQATLKEENLQTLVPFVAQRFVQFSYCDGRLLARSDRQDELDVIAKGAGKSTLGQIANATLRIRAQDGSVVIQQIRVSRDLYFRSGFPRELDAEYPVLEDTQYFLIGDNLPGSNDSRQNGPVQRRDITDYVYPAQ